MTTLAELAGYWRFGHLTELVTIYVVFLAVLVYLAQRETGVRITSLATLDDVLPGSRGYFAVASISLREWFDPSVQVYLARLFAHQAATPGFHHERVMLFLTPGSFLDVHSSLLDEYYARCLVKLHKQFDAVLGFLRPETLLNLLDELSPEERSALGYSRQPTGRMRRMAWRISPWKTRRLIEALRFAEVTTASGTTCIVKFLKSPGQLSVRTITEPRQIQPYPG